MQTPDPPPYSSRLVTYVYKLCILYDMYIKDMYNTENTWKVYMKCKESIQKVCRQYVGSIQEVSRKYIETISKVYREYIESQQKVYRK